MNLRLRSIVIAALLFAAACTGTKEDSCGNMATDPANCGQCGHACATGEVCSQGTCALSCSGGATQCGGSCVDTRWDPAHCGDCATACADGEVCAAGRCGVTCLGGSTLCDGLCVDVTKDPAHCGTCEKSCDGDLVCVSGECRLQCPTGTEKCGDACVDLKHDPLHCGSCENACSDGLVCSGGDCQLSCSGGTTKCDNACVNTANDPAHCGDCARACENGEVCSNGNCGLACVGGTSLCDGRCVDINMDSAHCGNCETVCENGEVCSNGNCGLECVGGATKCDGRCVDTSLDPANCGDCDKACENGEVCSSGSCGLECVGGTTLCRTLCVNTASDQNHCGDCEKKCLLGEMCVNGECTSPCGSLTACSGQCVDMTVDVANCGVCGRTCTTGSPNTAAVCVSSNCGETCLPGYANCDSDLETNGCETAIAASDASNCGGCGVTCAATETCQVSSCVDVAPAVATTSPANSDANVARAASIVVTFTEPVVVSGDWFAINCSGSGAYSPASSTVTGGPTTYAIKPNTGFFPRETCAVTIIAAQVTDEDTADPLDAMTADYQFSFSVTKTLFSEAFEAGMPAGWALFNIDGRTPDSQVSYVNAAWIVREDFAFNSSDHAAFSTSWYNPAGASDDWMMTPAIQLPPDIGCTLEWNAVAYDPAYRDGYEVRISTATQTAADGLANPALFSIGSESTAWTHRSVSLADYSGATVYLAFRNNSNDKFILLVDDVQVTCQ